MRHPEFTCSYACTGDASQTCGAAWIQQVYHTFNSDGKQKPMHMLFLYGSICDPHTFIYIFFFQKVPFWRFQQSDREAWLLSGTASENDALYPMEYVHDGEYHLAKSYLTKYELRPWIQIDMGSPQVVKSVKITGES